MAAILYARSLDPSRQLRVLPSDVEATKQEVNGWYFFAQARGGLAALYYSAGRWDDARQPSEKELKATSILRLPLSEVSAKMRIGDVQDDEPDYPLPVWAGVLPLRLTASAPIRDSRCDPDLPVPASVANFDRRLAGK